MAWHSKEAIQSDRNQLDRFAQLLFGIIDFNLKPRETPF